jgi:hypothetical protein
MVKKNPQKYTTICPIPSLNVVEVNEVSGDVTGDSDSDDEIDFVITPKQLDNMLKKNQVDECYLINTTYINDNDENLMVMVDTKNNNSDKSISEEEKINQEWIEELSKAYPNVFKGVIDSLPPLRTSVEDMIVLDPQIKVDAKPPYKMSPLELRELRRQLDILLKQGLIEPTSSEYGTPVLFVKSPGANPGDPPKMRMVCDYRSLNKATISQRIPVPRIDECLEQLDGAQYFSSIDLQSGFH